MKIASTIVLLCTHMQHTAIQKQQLLLFYMWQCQKAVSLHVSKCMCLMFRAALSSVLYIVYKTGMIVFMDMLSRVSQLEILCPSVASRGQSWPVVASRGQSWPVVASRGQSWSAA